MFVHDVIAAITTSPSVIANVRPVWERDRLRAAHYGLGFVRTGCVVRVGLADSGGSLRGLAGIAGGERVGRCLLDGSGLHTDRRREHTRAGLSAEHEQRLSELRARVGERDAILRSRRTRQRRFDRRQIERERFVVAGSRRGVVPQPLFLRVCLDERDEIRRVDRSRADSAASRRRSGTSCTSSRTRATCCRSSPGSPRGLARRLHRRTRRTSRPHHAGATTARR